MGLLGRIFGSEDVISKGTTGVINGVDKVFYTDEEKADNFGRMLTLYEPFKLAQRFLALIFSIPYVLAWIGTFIASFFVDTSSQEALLDGRIGYIVLTVAGFYFGGGAINGFVEAAVKTRNK